VPSPRFIHQVVGVVPCPSVVVALGFLLNRFQLDDQAKAAPRKDIVRICTRPTPSHRRAAFIKSCTFGYEVSCRPWIVCRDHPVKVYLYIRAPFLSAKNRSTRYIATNVDNFRRCRQRSDIPVLPLGCHCHRTDQHIPSTRHQVCHSRFGRTVRAAKLTQRYRNTA